MNESTIAKLLKHTDLVAAVAVVVVVTMLIVPLPSMLLDLFITINISAALAVVVATMYLQKPLEFSAFPSLLLLTTMFRLAINVSVTRLILTKGNAGSVVHDFGQFVVGGDVIIGLVIFLILVVIQFVVVTNGAGRVAEVAARFTLDAMPGKQMAIDADLNAGLITDEQARHRRQEIAREADFYGAMDGASKFVKGDAMAAVIITGINLLGGIVVGVVQKHVGFSQATHTYSMLTVGDGLAAQIPALLISVATGILVTRSASEKDLGSDLANQILRQKKAPLVAGCVVCMFALIPGLPKLPFLFIGGIMAAIGWSVRNGLPEELAAQAAAALPAQTQADKPTAPREEVLKELPIDPLELGIGFGLVPLVDRRTGGSLVRRVSMIRRQIASELGMVIPPVRIHDEVNLDSHEYVVKVRGTVVARGTVMAGHHLAMDPGDAVGTVAGIPTTEPAFGLPAIWIPEAQHAEAEALGDRHPPHRDHPQPRRPAAHAARRTPASGSAKGNQRSCRYGGCAGRSFPRRDPARVAVPPVGGRVDPRSGRDRRVRRGQGPYHSRYEPAGRIRPSGARPRDHRATPGPQPDSARDHARPHHRAGARDLDHPDQRRRVPGHGADPRSRGPHRREEPVR